MTDRDAQIAAFLAAHDWAGARRAPLGGDASFRRYERLHRNDEAALLMDAPPALEDVRPYLVVARHLVSLGYSAPRILAEDPEAGLLIIEDFGDQTYTRRLAEGQPEAALYELAIDLLADLHNQPGAVDVALPPYDDARLLEEAMLLVDWYLPALAEAPVPPALREEYEALWRGLFARARAVPDSLVLRDYHVDNLMWLESRHGVARCGILDFQDAVIGPVSYDLVSLLEDARRDVDADLADAMLARYLARFPALDRDAFAASYAILGAQRNCKIIGIFTRLSRRDGKPGYLGHIPRVWRLLEKDLRHPVLAPMAAWLDRNIEPARRIAPPDGAA